MSTRSRSVQFSLGKDSQPAEPKAMAQAQSCTLHLLRRKLNMAPLACTQISQTLLISCCPAKNAKTGVPVMRPGMFGPRARTKALTRISWPNLVKNQTRSQTGRRIRRSMTSSWLSRPFWVPRNALNCTKTTESDPGGLINNQEMPSSFLRVLLIRY